MVEDERAIRNLLKTGLEGLGYRVLLAPAGPEAFRIVAREHVDVLVTDVRLPGLSGPQVAGRIRRAQPGVKIVFISGHTDDLLTGDTLVDEGIPFLQKPFTAAELAHEDSHAVADKSAAKRR